MAMLTSHLDKSETDASLHVLNSTDHRVFLQTYCWKRYGKWRKVKAQWMC